MLSPVNSLGTRGQICRSPPRHAKTRYLLTSNSAELSIHASQTIQLVSKQIEYKDTRVFLGVCLAKLKHRHSINFWDFCLVITEKHLRPQILWSGLTRLFRLDDAGAEMQEAFLPAFWWLVAAFVLFLYVFIISARKIDGTNQQTRFPSMKDKQIPKSRRLKFPILLKKGRSWRGSGWPLCSAPEAQMRRFWSGWKS